MTVTKCGLTPYRIQILLLLKVKQSDERKFALLSFVLYLHWSQQDGHFGSCSSVTALDSNCAVTLLARTAGYRVTKVCIFFMKLTFDGGCLGSIPLQSAWDLWRTEWRCDRVCCEYVGFSPSVWLHQCSILCQSPMLCNLSSWQRLQIRHGNPFIKRPYIAKELECVVLYHCIE